MDPSTIIELSDHPTDAEWRAHLLSIGWEDEGWIDRGGTFWPVDECMDHGMTARTLLGPDGELLAEKRGWLRISDYGLHCARRLNQRQRDKLFDYCEHFRCDFREVLSDIKTI
jgi:hypothetical protein